ncbi:S-layer protein SlpA [Clostridioides sp. GD02377]|uniref:S-layer protein SlpA n=1 Tax=unclassified Clostridioides TaxID=2635829 RepID=UPI0038AD6EB9
MNKKSLAMAMAAVSVVGVAAPAYAATADELLNSTEKTKLVVSSNKASDLVTDLLDLQKDLDGNKNKVYVKEISFTDEDNKPAYTKQPGLNDGTEASKVVTGVSADMNNKDYVKKTLAGLDTGEFATITLTNKATIKVIPATEKTQVVSSDAKDVAKDLADKYVFNSNELTSALDLIDEDGFTKVDSYYQVTLYPEGKRLKNNLSRSASKYHDIAGLDSDAIDGNVPVILTLKSTSKSNLKTALDELQKNNDSYSNSTVIAGDDRIETAIELSKEYYHNGTDDTNGTKKLKDDVKNIVLVGSQAIVDGLVASPLAAEKDAPLLLTSKDKLDSSVKTEIKRVLDLKSSQAVTGKKVYIAGGKNSVSEDVVKELEEMGLKVVRLSGDDRYETSLAIADEIGIDDDKAFVVGGTGLADAMSIAPVASYNGADGVEKATPIIVVDGKAKSLTDEQESFLGSSNVDIIGGFASVSEDMEEAIADATGQSVDRIKGDDRQETNAEVIKNYFTKDKTDAIVSEEVKSFFLAKDGSTKEDQLVDALAAASIAGFNQAPIVLATDSISSDQSVAISKVVSEKGTKNLIQVGKGIANSVVNKLKDLLDM